MLTSLYDYVNKSQIGLDMQTEIRWKWKISSISFKYDLTFIFYLHLCDGIHFERS